MSREYQVGSRANVMVRGAPSLYSVQAHRDPTDPNNWIPLMQSWNTICVGMYDCVHNLLLRNFEDWQPTSIVLGFGGDYDQPEDPDTTPPADQGVKQEPAYTDAYVRKELFRAAIVQAQPSELTGEHRVHYIAIIRPDDALTDPDDPDRPYINEFGLEAYNGTLLAHFVTAEDLDTGRAEQYAKSNLEWLVIDWEIEFVGSVPA